MKTLRKEVADRLTSSLILLKQLGPIPRVYKEIISYEPRSIVYDSVKNHVKVNPAILKTINQPNSKDKAKNVSPLNTMGVQFSGVQKVNPWDIMAGVDGVLNLAWFGARQVPKEPNY